MPKAFSILEPRIYTAEEWGARPARVRLTRLDAHGIAIHNTATANRAAQTGEAEVHAAFALARSIQHYHMDKNGWSDTGQHFTISRGGIILEGRHGSLTAAKTGQVVRGAHAGNGEGNNHWFGIEVEGSNADGFHVLSAQWESVIELCAWLSFWGDFDSSLIRGHQEFTATDCPGHIMEHLVEMREAAHGRKGQIA